MAQCAPVQVASQNHIVFQCVNPERCLAATTDKEVTTEEYDPESVYQFWVKEGRDASFTLKSSATGEYLGIQKGLVVLQSAPFRWSYDSSVKQINPKSNNKQALTIDDDDVHNVEIKKGIPRDQSQKWNYFHPTPVESQSHIAFKCVNPERCLAATTDKEVTTEDYDPENAYQCWVKEGPDASFTLKSSATGEYLGVQNELVVLQSAPFRWGYDAAVKQINPKSNNKQALTIDDDDVHNVEIKKGVPRDQSQKWDYFSITQEAK